MDGAGAAFVVNGDALARLDYGPFGRVLSSSPAARIGSLRGCSGTARQGWTMRRRGPIRCGLGVSARRIQSMRGCSLRWRIQEGFRHREQDVHDANGANRARAGSRSPLPPQGCSGPPVNWRRLSSRIGEPGAVIESGRASCRGSIRAGCRCAAALPPGPLQASRRCWWRGRMSVPLQCLTRALSVQTTAPRPPSSVGRNTRRPESLAAGPQPASSASGCDARAAPDL